MFFNRLYAKGPDFYRAHFRLKPQHALVMEVTAQSFDHEAAPHRVRDTLGTELALLCPLRHPVQRSYSLYLHYLRYGFVQGSLQDAVRAVPQILTSSHYAAHLARWYETFGAQRIHLVYQEDLARDPHDFIARVCAALTIPFRPADPAIQGRYNVTSLHTNHHLARAAQHAADWLRARRFYALVNMGKRLGLKNMIFGAERPEITLYTIPGDDWRWLADRLLPEIETFEKLTGRTDHGWHMLGHGTQRAA